MTEDGYLKLDSIVIEEKNKMYFLYLKFTSPWGNFCASKWSAIVDNCFDKLSYYEFKKLFKSFNGKFNSTKDIYFNSQEEAEAFKSYLEGNLIMQKIIE